MIEARKNTIGLSKGWTFRSGISFDSLGSGANHDKLAQTLLSRECEIASVLIIINPLNRSHFDDPKFIRRNTELSVSEVESIARARMVNQYAPSKEVDKWIKDWGLLQSVNNYSTGKGAEDLVLKRRATLVEMIFQAHRHAIYPKILKEFREKFKSNWDAAGKGEGWEHAWLKEKIRLLCPTLVTSFNRIYNIPEPFNAWDQRSGWSQFYIVGMGGKAGVVRGGPGDASQRETHGRWAHAFATLANRGIDAPTYCYRYTSENKFVLDKSFERFRVYASDLTGAYPAQWVHTKDLFTKRLLSVSGEKIIETK